MCHAVKDVRLFRVGNTLVLHNLIVQLEWEEGMRLVHGVAPITCRGHLAEDLRRRISVCHNVRNILVDLMKM